MDPHWYRFDGVWFRGSSFWAFSSRIIASWKSSPTSITGFSLPVGIGLIAFGIVVKIVAVIRHRRYLQAIDRNEFRSAFGSKFAIFVASFLAMIGIAMTIYLSNL